MAGRNLEAALKKLDAKNDEHWTADGLPRMETLHELTGDNTLTRKQVSDQYANFNRDTQNLGKGEAPTPSGDTALGATSDSPTGEGDPRAAMRPDTGLSDDEADGPTEGTGGTDPDNPNPTAVGVTGNDEELGDKSIGVVGSDPENPESSTVEVADEDELQVDVDGTVTANAENTRNEGRSDLPVAIDVDGEETASRENERLLDNADMPPPQDADGSITSNRQTNDEDEARRASFPPDTADAEMGELERLEPLDPDADDDGADEEAKLSKSLQAAEDELNSADEDLTRLRSKRDRIQAQRDAIIERRERVVDRQAGMRERLAFINRQTEMRAERAGDLRAARELADLARGAAGSTLDQSMARDTRRGRNRPPARPLKRGMEA